MNCLIVIVVVIPSELISIEAYIQSIETAIAALTLTGADYSVLNNAIAAIPADLTIYTDESVAALQSTLDKVDYELDVTEQDRVDEYAQSILSATQNLKKLTWWQRLLRAIAALFKRILLIFQQGDARS